MDYLVVVLLVAAVAAAFVVIARSSALQGRRSRAESEHQLALAKSTAQTDVIGLAEALSRFDANEPDPAARADFQHASAAHSRALICLREATEPDALSRVTESLEKGRWSLARLIARRAGLPLPMRRPPCFFNPGHGPSTANIIWQGRNVPACAADAVRVASGADPYIRTVVRDNRRVPYWEGGPTYAGWARGYFASWRGSALVSDIARSKV